MAFEEGLRVYGVVRGPKGCFSKFRGLGKREDGVLLVEGITPSSKEEGAG